MELDFKEKWIKRRQRLYNSLLADPAYPYEYKRRVQQHPYGMYETPKVYDENGVAFNDGSWLIYNTCRVADDKFRGKVFCKSATAAARTRRNGRSRDAPARSWTTSSRWAKLSP